tara:strand:+ start:311 stop:871 length:561 start_codon:yes stop_codon:yes gene_type:complete
MRIIAGNFKGKKIHLPADKKTRPLRDLVKESIFNLIEHSNKFNVKISNANILDLFSGSGSFGLECISRGANNVTFVENYKSILNILKRNISSINTVGNYEIIEEDCFKVFENEIFFKIKFDIIFIDPPYKEKKINFLLNKISKHNILKKNGIVVLHRHKKDIIEISNTFNVFDQRSYGISKIIIGN